MLPPPSVILSALLTLLAGAVGGVLVVAGAASRAGLPAPSPAALATAGAIGLASSIPVAFVVALLVRTRPARRVLPPVLFPALGVCLFLGPYDNHALTGAGVLVSVTLAVIAILFFMRTRPSSRDAQMRCPTCAGAITPRDARCPHCAVILKNV